MTFQISDLKPSKEIRETLFLYVRIVSGITMLLSALGLAGFTFFLWFFIAIGGDGAKAAVLFIPAGILAAMSIALFFKKKEDVLGWILIVLTYLLSAGLWALVRWFLNS